MRYGKAKRMRLVLPKAALTAVFDECDRFDRDETGGRIIGTFTQENGELVLFIHGIIDAGPGAQRTPVSFFQDGEYQERIFRKIECDHPEIEHLGNWHTHHVNGLSTLSSGDITTYGRTVNHEKHNTPFFYALLVVAKRKTRDPLRRYTVKHYIFRRDDEHVYEVPPKLVELVDTPLLWPASTTFDVEQGRARDVKRLGPEPQRVYDQDMLRDFYEQFRPFASEKLGLYWRGTLVLLDGSKMELIVVEDSSSQLPAYSIVFRDTPDNLKAALEQLGEQRFPSARAALITTERRCNEILYTQRGHQVTGSN
jgi:hypothetical protein